MVLGGTKSHQLEHLLAIPAGRIILLVKILLVRKKTNKLPKYFKSG